MNIKSMREFGRGRGLWYVLIMIVYTWLYKFVKTYISVHLKDWILWYVHLNFKIIRTLKGSSWSSSKLNFLRKVNPLKRETVQYRHNIAVSITQHNIHNVWHGIYKKTSGNVSHDQKKKKSVNRNRPRKGKSEESCKQSLCNSYYKYFRLFISTQHEKNYFKMDEKYTG